MPLTQSPLTTDALAQLFASDPATATAQVAQRARAGDLHAQVLYAQLLCEGRGMERAPEEGLHWYTVAATAGHLGAMNMVARCHERGYGTAQDPALAALWYKRAADGGLEWAMYKLANLLATGRGAARDLPQAWSLYLRAARAGHAKSMNLVGRFLEEGLVVAADPEAALDWYRRSAEAGDFRGQASLAAVLFQRGQIQASVHWLETAITGGSPGFLQQLAAQLQSIDHPAYRPLLPRIADRLATLDPMASG